MNALFRSPLIVRKLHNRDRLLLVEAWLELLRAALIIRTPFRSGIFHTPRPRSMVRSAFPQSLHKLDYYLNAAASHHLFPIRCLEKALAGQRMCQRRGVPCQLEMGFRREADTTFAGHAWLSSPLLGLAPPDFAIMKREFQ